MGEEKSRLLPLWIPSEGSQEPSEDTASAVSGEEGIDLEVSKETD